ncbi:hypothetical protein H4R19_006061 [Coemansia spiralis]|nr:hypothetical protein H4R19_006061 [Coemansia spiralis]
MAPTQPPPPPPPPQPAAKDPQAVPVREGKWTFHPPAEFPAPPSGKIPPHAYPSGNYTGSALNVSI